jgi:hypothetical protein
MTDNKKTTFYWLTFAAHIFFMLFGLIWMLISAFSGKFFNFSGFFVFIVFGGAAYFKNKWVNLITGIINLFASFFVLMEVLSGYNLLSHDHNFSVFAKIMFFATLMSVFFSGILIFSFLKIYMAEQRED